MRVISGNLKGKIIQNPTDKNTRPLRDMVKESIFNLIQHSKKINFSIENSKVLDLFSGSGSFGLECISRGANFVIFVENYKDILQILKKNLNSLKIENKFKIYEQDCFKFFQLNKNLNQRFNIIFMDPPYKEKNINLLIKEILDHRILEKSGVFIVHRHKSDKTEISKDIKILDERIYGISRIIIGTSIK